ncbi:DUF1298 domain-containing protein [Citricoccus sp. SGAir0253]|uniref:wax ester/triacylglycerol synthase domain-containing protein n=1 Tax=Citricoccus sp. SGAir0253 TaxID=2567881 RepID=UPI0010CCC483|nr:wax ester/triacylglycerol synthase domain-containing protein [Citricoccus sp. SGAir0253]QCU78723.1 DUF1298 domain-containing protein [Citricoccus sp. SGAir0253]
MRATDARLAPADEANLVLDHPGQVNVFLVAVELGPGGAVRGDGTPDPAAVRAVLAERVAGIPELGRALVRTGRHHHWRPVDPDLEHHVRLLAPVHGRAGLEALCGDLMATPLVRDRPPWEVLLVAGVAAGRAAAVLRIHHAVADGMGAVAIAHRLFDPPQPPADAPPAAGSPVERTMGRGGPGPGPVAGAAPRRRPGRALARCLRGLVRTGRTLAARGVGPTLLLGARGPRPAVAFLEADLAGLLAAARAAGATVNDVLLSAVAVGLRAALAEAGERIPDRLPVSVPVALHRHGPARNQVGVMLVRLPLGRMEPARRLGLVAAQTRVAKAAAREQGTLEFMRGPLGARVMDRLARRQRLVAGFVTNVPGPSRALRLAGAPVTRLWPVPALSGNVRVAVGALSYAGRLSCSVHADADHVPVDAVVRAMAGELARWDGTGAGPAGTGSPGRSPGAGPVD